MWYDKQVIKILFMIAKILSRRSEKCFPHEIEQLEKEITNNKEETKWKILI